MTSRENSESGPFRSSSENEPSQIDAERLRLVGEFLVNTSSLIAAIHRLQLADEVDYRLTFPIFPQSPAIIPSAAVDFAEELSSVEVNASYIRSSETGPAAPSLRIVVETPSQELIVSRTGTTAQSETSPNDTVLDTKQQKPDLSLRDELRFATGSEFDERLHSVAGVPQKEINSLLLSLALPESYGDVLYTTQDLNLMADPTFLWLLESLRHQAMTTDTSGVYLFPEDKTAKLSFHRVDGNDSFTLTIVDPLTGEPRNAHGDTSNGIELDFTTYEDEGISKPQPSNDDIAFFNSIVSEELARLEGQDVHGDIFRTADPEAIAVDSISEQEDTLDDLGRQINDIELD